MPKHAQNSPQPLLVLVTGKPGSGKSTLAIELGRAQNLGLPVLSRDAIKAGMVETWAFVRPGAARDVIETDELRSSLVPNSFDLFYETIAHWLQEGTSLIAEYGFDRRTEPALANVIGLARTAVVQCEAPDDVSQRRFIRREQRDGKIRADRLAATIERIASGADPWTQFEPLNMALPTLRVETERGYRPTLAEICAFCRDVAGRPDAPLMELSSAPVWKGLSMTRRLISSGSTFEAEIGYSRAVVDGDWVFVSGTTGFDYSTMTIAEDVVAQTEQCLKNIAAALAEAGAAFDDIVRVTYVLPDASEFEQCWPTLREYFGAIRPAAMMISAGLSDPRMRIEIEVTAKKRVSGEQ
jgi:enamine deaminase RidA (YjgF/YER057c/UK114 family)/predicted kinase